MKVPFPLVTNKSLRVVGMFLKSLPSDSDVSPGVRQRMTEMYQGGWRRSSMFCQKVLSQCGRSECRCARVEQRERH